MLIYMICRNTKHGLLDINHHKPLEVTFIANSILLIVTVIMSNTPGSDDLKFCYSIELREPFYIVSADVG